MLGDRTANGSRTRQVDVGHDWPRTGWHRRIAAIAAALLVMAGLSVWQAPSSDAYVLHGCKWGTASLNIRNDMPTGTTYRTLMSAAGNTWSNTTDINLTWTGSTGASFSAKQQNNGANGYAGYAYWTCAVGYFANCRATLNPYYTDGYSGPRRLAVSSHELGHCLGLDHVAAGLGRIMEPCPRCTYDNFGTNTPQSDDKNGVNALY